MLARVRLIRYDAPMPITTSAKKALRSAARKRAMNLRRKGAVVDVVKEMKKLVLAGKKEDARALFSKAAQAIDKAAKRGVMKPNAAARKKSRLVAFIKR